MECFWLSLFRHPRKTKQCFWLFLEQSHAASPATRIVVIIITNPVAGLAAWLCPVDEENAKEEAHEA